MVTVVEACEFEIAELAKREPRVAKATEAATALSLARELDDDNSATSKSMCARALNETMALLRGMVPADAEKDSLDELEARRASRRAG